MKLCVASQFIMAAVSDCVQLAASLVIPVMLEGLCLRFVP